MRSYETTTFSVNVEHDKFLDEYVFMFRYGRLSYMERVRAEDMKKNDKMFDFVCHKGVRTMMSAIATQAGEAVTQLRKEFNL